MQAMPRQIWNHDQIGHENEVLGVRLGHGTGDQYFAGDAPSQYGTDGDTHGGDVLLGYGTDIEPVMEMGFWVPRRGTAYQPRVQPWDQKTQYLAF